MKFDVSHFSVISFTPRLPRNIFHNRSAIPSRGSAKQLAKVILGWALLCLLLAAPDAWAQIRSATITGTVTDATGAVVPNADIIVTETATNVSYPSKTDGEGLYTVPYLEAGDYAVTITKAGFEKSTVDQPSPRSGADGKTGRQTDGWSGFGAGGSERLDAAAQHRGRDPLRYDAGRGHRRDPQRHQQSVPICAAAKRRNTKKRYPDHHNARQARLESA